MTNLQTPKEFARTLQDENPTEFNIEPGWTEDPDFELVIDLLSEHIGLLPREKLDDSDREALAILIRGYYLPKSRTDQWGYEEDDDEDEDL